MCLSRRREKAIQEQAELKTQNWLKRMRLDKNDQNLTRQMIDDKRSEFESQIRELLSHPRNPRRKMQTARSI